MELLPVTCGPPSPSLTGRLGSQWLGSLLKLSHEVSVISIGSTSSRTMPLKYARTNGLHSAAKPQHLHRVPLYSTTSAVDIMCCTMVIRIAIAAGHTTHGAEIFKEWLESREMRQIVPHLHCPIIISTRCLAKNTITNTELTGRHLKGILKINLADALAQPIGRTRIPYGLRKAERRPPACSCK